MSIITTPWLTLSNKDPNTATAIDPIIAAPYVDSVAVFPLNIGTNDTLKVQVLSPSAEQVIKLDISKYIPDTTQATADQLVAAISNEVLNGFVASKAGGQVRLTSLSSELNASVKVNGGNLNTALGFPTTEVSRAADVAFKNPHPGSNWGKALFTIQEVTNTTTAITAVIDCYGWSPQHDAWHKFQTVSISEAGICDFFLIAPIAYDWIYLSHSSGSGSYKASYSIST